MANKPDIDPNAFNRIIDGTEIKGDIISKDDFRFDGKLTGNINTAGKIIIGHTGVVKGEIKCKNADVSGKIEGKITVTELLSLKNSAHVNGDIITNKLAIEPGSRFTGSCSMENSQAMPHGSKEEDKTKK
jgi:cytoskeletal protein CcmA (bactofilin family)